MLAGGRDLGVTSLAAKSQEGAELSSADEFFLHKDHRLAIVAISDLC